MSLSEKLKIRPEIVHADERSGLQEVVFNAMLYERCWQMPERDVGERVVRATRRLLQWRAQPTSGVFPKGNDIKIVYPDGASPGEVACSLLAGWPFGLVSKKDWKQALHLLKTSNGRETSCDLVDVILGLEDWYQNAHSLGGIGGGLESDGGSLEIPKVTFSRWDMAVRLAWRGMVLPERYLGAVEFYGKEQGWG